MSSSEIAPTLVKALESFFGASAELRSAPVSEFGVHYDQWLQQRQNLANAVASELPEEYRHYYEDVEGNSFGWEQSMKIFSILLGTGSLEPLSRPMALAHIGSQQLFFRASEMDTLEFWSLFERLEYQAGLALGIELDRSNWVVAPLFE